MAQGDLFSQFAGLGGILEKAAAANIINDKKRLELLDDVYTAELNIKSVRDAMLKSDSKSLNIFKKLADVAGNISDATKRNLNLKQKINESEQSIGELEKARQK